MNATHHVRRSYLLPLAALAAVTVLLVPPAGDFPLNDDWVYAAMAKTLLEEHRFAPHPYAAAYALFQTLWGAGFCAAFGTSFTVLRASTLALAVTAAWLTARCAREAGAARGMALLCGAVLFANPLFLNLSYTFMTEVPYLALMAASGCFYLRALRRGRAADIMLGSVFAALAFSNRQYGVLSSVAFAGAALTMCRTRPRLRSIAALIGPWIAVAAGFVACGIAPASPFHRIGLAGDISRARQIGIVLNVAFSCLPYIGLFLLPFAAAVVVRRRRWTHAQWAWCIGIAGFYALAMLLGAQPLPRLPNMLRDAGVGPLTLYDAYFVHRGWSPVTLPAGAWRAITIVSAISAGTLVAQWIGTVRAASRSRCRTHPIRLAQYRFLVLWAAMLLFSPLNPALTIYFDRYLLPGAVPLLVLSAAGLGGRMQVTAGVGAVVPALALYAFSLASLQDYLAWNRARWDAIAMLRTKYGAMNEQIDGGYEFNGMYTSERFRALHAEKPLHYSGERPWWVIDGVYAVSFLPRDGYVEIDRARYRSWLRGDDAYLLLLKRSP